MKKTALILAVLLVAVLAILTACTGKQQESATDLDYITNKGTLIIGITDFAPMDYQNENGEWIGFDADMAKAFAEYLGVTPEFQVIEWDIRSWSSTVRASTSSGTA